MRHSLIEMLDKSVRITLMQPSDFKEINQWCIDEGWNLGLHDSEIFYKIDPQGHYIAKTSEKLASLSLIKHSPTFFTLGPFIVHKSYRRQGLGEALWNVAIDRMTQEHPDALIVLYAVAEQVERYKKAGFVPVATIQRWYLDSGKAVSPSISEQCLPISQELIPSLSQYDQRHSIASRELLFKELSGKPEIKGLVFMDDNLIKGFGFIRPCIRGCRIGPLVADTADIAQSLIAGLSGLAQRPPVLMEVPDLNPQALNCMQAFDASRTPQEDTVMMIKGTGYSSYLKQWQQHYALFSLEIG